jgi:prepilin-type N-terminal cleavage/methylation domain-containing protein
LSSFEVECGIVNVMKSVRTGRRAFTLIELLVVIAIITVLAVIVIVILNPSILLQQARDSSRVSDMNTLTKALNTYNAQNGGGAGYSLGTPGIIYLSLPDPAATTTAGSNCAGLGFPSSGYHCSASSTYRLTDGTGWVPVNFASLSTGSPISVLPIDPINTSSSGQYYEYETDGTTFDIASEPESQKYSPQGVNFEAGSNRSLLAAFDVLYATSTYPVSPSTSSLMLSALAFDSHTNTIWVTNSYSFSPGNSVSQINDTTYATSTFGTQRNPTTIAFDSHTNTIWVGNFASSSITIFNDTTFTSTTVPLAYKAYTLIFDPNTNTMWMGTSNQGYIVAMNDTTYATTSIPGYWASQGSMAFDSHTNSIWISNSFNNTAVVINDSTYAASSIPLSGSGVAAFDPHTNTIWMTGSSGFTQINDTTYATSTVPLSIAGSYAMAFDPHTDSIWAGIDATGTTYQVLQVNDTSYATTTFVVAGGPQEGVVFDPHTNTIWVGNEGSTNNTVTQFTPNH